MRGVIGDSGRTYRRELEYLEYLDFRFVKRPLVENHLNISS